MQNDLFFQEYTSQDAILKYTRATAGFGISYLLDHDYKRVYVEALKQLPAEVRQREIRILEFGCGAGMNLVHLVSVLNGEGIKVKEAIGTDFSPVLIEAARSEAKQYLRHDQQQKVQFHVAMNETLVANLSAALAQSSTLLESSFDFILGVNTIRYSHRARKQLDCAADILKLLSPGGVCVVIDMNDRFPFYRSTWRNRFRGEKENEEECYIPSLAEYTAPFKQAGFEVLRSEHFCWIPHSAGRSMCRLIGAMSPVLNAVAKTRAIRSLVVARKPASMKGR